MSPLRAIRQSQGLSLAAVAQQANLTESALSRIERGERLPSLPALVRLARVLGLRELERHLALYADRKD